MGSGALLGPDLELTYTHEIASDTAPEEVETRLSWLDLNIRERNLVLMRKRRVRPRVVLAIGCLK